MNRSRTTRVLAQLGCVAALALLSSCTSTWYSARFVPAPLEVELRTDGAPTAQARALVTVRGIRRAVAKEHQPAQVEVRMRIENMAESAVVLEAESLELVAADLQPFDRPRVTPDPSALIEPRQDRVFDIVFAVPAGKELKDFDLRGLNLKWEVAFGERRVTTGITFERYVPPSDAYYDPFYPHTHIGVGVGVIGHFSDR